MTTDRFGSLAQRVAEAQHFPDLPRVIIPHPLGASPRLVQEKAETVVHQIVGKLVGRIPVAVTG